MAHSNKQQPDFSKSTDSHNRLKSQALSRDIEELNKGLRVDFDQKLSELGDLLSRFKALMTTPSMKAANDEGDTNLAAQNQEVEIRSATVTSLCTPAEVGSSTDNNLSNLAAQDSEGDEIVDSNNTVSPDSVTKHIEVVDPEAVNANESVDDTHAAIPKVIAATSAYSTETARFESGLYKLNCQLYRFRLELDQELEFREEPLHIHFRQESDLSQLFQKLSEESGEKYPDN